MYGNAFKFFLSTPGKITNSKKAVKLKTNNRKWELRFEGFVFGMFVFILMFFSYTKYQNHKYDAFAKTIESQLIKKIQDWNKFAPENERTTLHTSLDSIDDQKLRRIVKNFIGQVKNIQADGMLLSSRLESIKFSLNQNFLSDNKIDTIAVYSFADILEVSYIQNKFEIKKDKLIIYCNQSKIDTSCGFNMVFRQSSLTRREQVLVKYQKLTNYGAFVDYEVNGSTLTLRPINPQKYSYNVRVILLHGSSGEIIPVRVLLINNHDQNGDVNGSLAIPLRNLFNE